MLRLLFVVLLFVSASAFEFEGKGSVRLLGRWNAAGQANWPSSGLETVVRGTAEPSLLTVEFDQCSSDVTTCCNYFVTTVLNGVSLGNININPTSLTVNITVPASSEDSVVRVLKITEASLTSACGTMSFKSVRSTAPLSSTSASLGRRLKMQVFGAVSHIVLVVSRN